MSENFENNETENIIADIIILGCSLPGIVAAHSLKKKFGDSMEIVVLDLAGDFKKDPSQSQMNVSFHIEKRASTVSKPVHANSLSQQLILKWDNEFNLSLPNSIVKPETLQNDDDESRKIFQYTKGEVSETTADYNLFQFVNIFQRFELNQFQTSLNESITSIYLHTQTAQVDELHLTYYDSTSMDEYIRKCLFLETSRNVMRTLVRVVCGANADMVSVLFFLHQSYRVNGVQHHIGSSDTRLRERILALCRRKLTNKLMEQVADIMRPTLPIGQIRTFTDHRVILETIEGEENYVCTLLALALRPDQLRDIHLEDRLLSNHRSDIDKILALTQNHSTAFFIVYRKNFWREQGYSGDIFSLKGPILWAMEKPILSGTGSEEKYYTLMGYIKESEDDSADPELSNKPAVIAQLMKLFGDEASDPVEYKEKDFIDVYVPRCGDYLGMRRLMYTEVSHGLEWGALDVFGEGDLGASLEAGHMAYLHLVNTLRPQARSYSDVSAAEWHSSLPRIPISKYFSSVNYTSSAKALAMGLAAYFAYYSMRESLEYVVGLEFP